ncbi:MAG: aldo/keto reductase, partial [Desulfovibrio sp.]
TSVMIGANNESQLAVNLGAANVTLTRDEIAKLDELTAPTLPYPAWMQPMGRDAQVAEALGV